MAKSDFEFLVGKSVGLITNSAATNQTQFSLVKSLYSNPEINLRAIFSPEHGFFVNHAAGEHVQNKIFSEFEIPIYSLFGDDRKPTPEMLKGLDVLVFDVQEIGARFYTYISTLKLAMEAAFENDIEFVVLDRPNPISVLGIGGPILEQALVSFVGIAPIAQMHGLTIGEFAKMLVGENWISVQGHLHVVKMLNWNHKTSFKETQLKWRPPSPNIPNVETAMVYPGMGMIEATNLSEGRGTEAPFLTIGAPWLNSTKVREQFLCPGIAIDTMSFVPMDIKGTAINPKYKGKLCHGLKFSVINADCFKPIEFSIHLICLIRDLHPKTIKINRKQMERLTGSVKVTEGLISGKSALAIIKSYQAELDDFEEIRQKYLLYD